MAFFSRRLCFLTRALKIIGNWPIYSLGGEVSAFGNAGAVGKHDNRAGAHRAPFCAAVDLGF
jgi:hypothetical protein